MRLMDKIRNKKGSSLVIVVIAFAVISIISISLITVVTYSSDNSSYYHSKQQAEITARNVMNTLESSFANPLSAEDILKELTETLPSGTPLVGTGTLADHNMGSYEVSLVYDDTILNKPLIKADVVSMYNGANYKLSATFKEGKGDRINPFDFIAFARSSVVGINGGSADITTFDGNVYSHGALTPKDVLFKGNLMCNTSLTFNPGCNAEVLKKLVANGAISPREADLYTRGIVNPGSFFNSGYVGFDADIITHQRTFSSIYYNYSSSTGLLSIQDMVISSLTQDLTFPKSIIPGDKIQTFPSPPGSPITIEQTIGILIVPLAVYVPGNPVITLPQYDNAGIALLKPDGTPLVDTYHIVDKIYTSHTGDTLDCNNIILPVIAPPTIGTIMPASPVPAGSYNVSRFNPLSPTTLDTTSGDIHLYAQSDLTIAQDIEIEGDHNVYIHLGGTTFTPTGKDITINNNVDVGQNDHTEHQLYVEGVGSEMVLLGDSTFRGAVYLPGGDYTDSAMTSGIKFEGSITAESINVTAGNTYTYVDYYKEPVFNATLVDPNAALPEDDYFIPLRLPPNVIDWTFVEYGE